MKKLFDSPKILIVLILIFIAVIVNRETISNTIKKAITHFFSDDNYVEQWQIKPENVYDGDTLRIFKDNEELIVRLCGIDAPEMLQTFGVESRDYLRTLIDKSNGTIHILPIKDNRSKITIVEAWITIEPDYEEQIHLNTAMLEAGLAYHYKKYSSNCKSVENLVRAAKIGSEKRLSNYCCLEELPPWEWRKANELRLD
ncbi:MAG: hypothetical protein Tsb0014_34260 [Pleurocapsa sp.]